MTNLVAANDKNIIERFSKIFERKDQIDDVSSTINEDNLNQLAGRATQGANESDFEYVVSIG